MGLIALVPDRTLADALYYGPSPLPMMWAWFIRALPWAVVVVWPVLRLIPQELDDAARLEGASAVGRLARLVVPLSLVALAAAGLVAFGQAIAEVAASKLATTPGVDTFTLLVFDRMHYGVAQDVASLCLVLLALLLLGGAEMMLRARCFAAIQRVR
jgi:ABC-type spermidine/putrescine transport system permease subunit II